MAVAVLISSAQPLAVVGLGWLLLRTRLFSTADGETAAKFAVWFTLPSLILQSFNGLALADIQLPVVLGALPVTMASAGLSWLCYRQRHPKERGLLAGAAGGGAALHLAAYPLVAATFGAPGLRIALLAGVANSLAVWLAGSLLFSTAGAAFPEAYEHIDGGTYRGEWLGMLKQGYGVYTYPSGARYEGEWRNNLKEGRGVYRFPKGGVYEGEWRGGRMDGVGVRTFASGKVQAGVWREGKLASEMKEWQCALAVEGASEAAAVARRVQVGGGTLGEAVQQLLADPPTWAYAAALVLALMGRQLTPSLDLVTASLAAAHAPLALLALGMTLDELVPPQPRQAGDISALLALRLLPPLLMAMAACACLPRLLGWTAAHTLGLVGPMLVLAYAHRFRLNESLVVAITYATVAVGLVLMPLLAVAASVSAAAGSVLPFQVALGGVASSVAAVAVAGAVQGQQQAQRKIRMRYAPPAAAAPAAVPAVATSTPASAPAAAALMPVADAGNGSATSTSSSSNDAGAASRAAAPVEPPGQAPPRRSAFSDVGPEQRRPPQPPQALGGCRQGRRLRWQQPMWWQQQRMGQAVRVLPSMHIGAPAALRAPL